MRLLYIAFLLLTLNIFGYKPENLVRINENTFYSWTSSQGVLFSSNNLKSCQEKNEGLLKKVVYPWENNEFQTITYLHIDNHDIKRLALTTSFGLFLSDDSANTWREIKLKDPVKSSNYITSVALSSLNKDKILLGTSFNGIFESLDGGKTWNRFFKNYGFRSKFLMGADFFEEISAIAYDPNDDNIIYISKGFANGLYKTVDRKVWTKIDFPSKSEIINLRFIPNLNSSPVLEVYTKDKIFKYSTISGEWIGEPVLLPKIDRSLTIEKAQRVQLASRKVGLYIRSDKATGRAFENHLSMIKNKGMNSFVLDMKDDNGFLTYDSQLEYPKSIKAVATRFNLKKVIERAHKDGIYVIGRIVVFKDPKLYKADPKWTIWDKSINSSWGYRFKLKNKKGQEYIEQKEFWIDPYNEEVWDYNIDIAVELQQNGVDEIQFDYIRFPTDGPVNRCFYRYKKPGMNNIDALESFLKKARESITIPISTDLYGYNCYFRMGNWMGQNITTFSKYVDAISPMFYPSHFPRNFEFNNDYLVWSKKIYKDGSNRSVKMVGENSVIRPYVQAFRMPVEYFMNEPTYKQYLLEQLEGTIESDASGWTLWNNSQKYYMVDKSLDKYSYIQ